MDLVLVMISDIFLGYLTTFVCRSLKAFKAMSLKAFNIVIYIHFSDVLRGQKKIQVCSLFFVCTEIMSAMWLQAIREMRVCAMAGFSLAASVYCNNPFLVDRKTAKLSRRNATSDRSTTLMRTSGVKQQMMNPTEMTQGLSLQSYQEFIGGLAVVVDTEDTPGH